MTKRPFPQVEGPVTKKGWAILRDLGVKKALREPVSLDNALYLPLYVHNFKREVDDFIKVPKAKRQLLQQLKKVAEQLQAMTGTTENEAVRAAVQNFLDVADKEIPEVASDERYGCWGRLYNSRARLMDLMRDKTGTERNPGSYVLKKGTISHRNELDNDLLYKYLIEFMGLKGEFSNGPEYAIDLLLRNRPLQENFSDPAVMRSYVDAVRRVIDLFDAPSQDVMRAQGIVHSTVIDGVEKRETKLEAIKRVGDEIEKWVNVNEGRETDLDIPAIRAELSRYRAAYEEVKQKLPGMKAVIQDIDDLAMRAPGAGGKRSR